MPRFHLHLHDGTGTTTDEVGSDFSNQTAARIAALDGIREIVSEEARAGTIDLLGHVDIQDHDGNELVRVDFAEAFAVRTDDVKS